MPETLKTKRLTSACICGSGKSFGKCCARFLSGEQRPRTPEQLMRSRYSAYALGDQGEYLLESWFPATARGLTAAALSRRSCDWIRLEILSKSQQGDEGFVEFNAWFRGQNGEEEVLHEKSVFQRVAGRWFYVGGEVHSTPGQAVSRPG
jgi:SEC-C motif-containing protein